MKKPVRMLLWAAGAAVGLFIFLRFLLPWTAPVLLAYLLATALEKPVERLTARRLPRPLAAALMTVLTFSLAGVLVTGLVLRLSGELSRLAENLPALTEKLTALLSRGEVWLRSLLSPAQRDTGGYADKALATLNEALFALPGRLAGRVMELLAAAAQSTPGVLLFLITAGVGCYFFSASYPRVTAFLASLLPPRGAAARRELREELRRSLGGVLRTEVLLTGITFLELTAAFLLLGIREPLFLAAAVAVVDALPVLGTGAVLVPWGLYALLSGDRLRALGLLVTWAATVLVRNALQAKLLGDRIGLDPLLSLLAVYMGWQIWGVGGMLLFPPMFVIARKLYDLKKSQI